MVLNLLGAKARSSTAAAWLVRLGVNSFTSTLLFNPHQKTSGGDVVILTPTLRWGNWGLDSITFPESHSQKIIVSNFEPRVVWLQSLGFRTRRLSNTIPTLWSDQDSIHWRHWSPHSRILHLRLPAPSRKTFSFLMKSRFLLLCTILKIQLCGILLFHVSFSFRHAHSVKLLVLRNQYTHLSPVRSDKESEVQALQVSWHVADVSKGRRLAEMIHIVLNEMEIDFSIPFLSPSAPILCPQDIFAEDPLRSTDILTVVSLIH